jgi:hypothetical protein
MVDSASEKLPEVLKGVLKLRVWITPLSRAGGEVSLGVVVRALSLTIFNWS